MVQYESASIVTGLRKGTSRVKLYGELGWDSLQKRRKKRKLRPLCVDLMQDKRHHYHHLIKKTYFILTIIGLKITYPYKWFFSREPNLVKLYGELGWDSLQNRRKKRKLILMFKALQGELPNYKTNNIIFMNNGQT
jgi:hypothetical protein